MLLIYRGAHPDVYVLDGNDEIPLRDKNGEPVEEASQGEPVEVPDHIAVKLLEQDTWEKASAPAQPAKPASTRPSAPLTPAQGTGA